MAHLKLFTYIPSLPVLLQECSCHPGHSAGGASVATGDARFSEWLQGLLPGTLGPGDT